MRCNVQIMNASNSKDELDILCKISNSKASTQRKLAKISGLSLGKLNYCINALKKRGYVKYKNFKLSNFLKIPINGNLSIRNQSFELKNNFFTKLMFTIKRTSISLFFPNFLKKLLSRFIYRKPNQIKIDNLLKKKLKIYFLEDMNFIKDIKF